MAWFDWQVRTRAEFEKRQKMGMPNKKFEHRMKEFAKTCWVTMEAMNQVGNNLITLFLHEILLSYTSHISS